MPSSTGASICDKQVLSEIEVVEFGLEQTTFLKYGSGDFCSKNIIFYAKEI